MELPRRSPSLTPGESKKTRQYILLPSSTLPKRSPGSSLNQTSERKKKDASNPPSKATKDKSKKGNRRGESAIGSADLQTTSSNSSSMEVRSSVVSNSHVAVISDSIHEARNWRSLASLKKPMAQGRGIGKGAAKRLSKSQKKPLVHTKVDSTHNSSRGRIKKAHLPCRQSSVAGPSAPSELDASYSEDSMELEEEGTDGAQGDSDEDGSARGGGRRNNTACGLPRSLLQNLFCLYSKKRVSRDAMDLVLAFVESCVKDLCVDMARSAGQARRDTVLVNDVISLMNRQRSISSHGRGWEELVHTHLPMDYAQTLLPCSLIRHS